MHYINKVILAAFTCLSLGAYDIIAQEQQATSKTHPCQFAPKFSDFNFWLGHWDVYGDIEKTTPLFGTNTIEKDQNGCLVTENWVGASGSTGTSMNYYDGTKEKWVQHWVSATGTVINIEGGLEHNSMTLTGKIFYINTEENPVRDFRGTWTPVKAGVVRQFFEESVDGGKTWYPWFEGFYFRSEIESSQ